MVLVKHDYTVAKVVFGKNRAGKRVAKLGQKRVVSV